MEPKALHMTQRGLAGPASSPSATCPVLFSFCSSFRFHVFWDFISFCISFRFNGLYLISRFFVLFGLARPRDV